MEAVRIPEPEQVIRLAAQATHWVSDEPFPGFVEVVFDDRHGHTHRIIEKAVVVGDALTPSSTYPVEVRLPCLVRHRDFTAGVGDRGVQVVDLSPDGLCDPDAVYSVHRSQLSHGRPTLYSDLSIAARQAVALTAFRRWRARTRRDVPELNALEAHLWAYPAVDEHTFTQWHDAHPWTSRELTADPPLPLRTLAADLGLPLQRLAEVVEALIEVTYGGLFGGVESRWSLLALHTVLDFTGAQGVAPPDPEPFAGSLWIDDDWGRPSPQQVHDWRSRV